MARHQVKGLWWEGQTLKVVDEDGTLLVFKNCYPVSTSDELMFTEANGTGEIRIKFNFDFSKYQQ